MADNLVSKELNILFFQAQTVVFFLFVPLLELDDKIDGLGIFYALDTKQCLDVDDTDTAQLDKVTRDIRCRSDQRNVADTADFNHIITDETMASFDQLQCSLALSDSALAHDQNALAEYIDQHAVDGDHRGKLDIQPADDFSHENGSRFVYRKGRYLITIAQIQNFRSRNHLRCENDTWDLTAYKLFKRADALALFKMLQIRELYITYDLHTLIGKMLIVTGQLQCRTVDIRCGNDKICHINLWCQVAEIHFLHHFGHFNFFHFPVLRLHSTSF